MTPACQNSFNMRVFIELIKEKSTTIDSFILNILSLPRTVCLFKREFWEKRRQFPMQIPSGGKAGMGKIWGSGFPPSNPSGDSSHKQLEG